MARPKITTMDDLLSDMRRRIRRLELRLLRGSGGIDTGWVDVPLINGHTAPSTPERPMVRRIGNVVHMRGGVSSTGITAGSSPYVASMPAEFRPPVNVPGAAGSSSAAAIAVGFIYADGRVQLRTSATLGGYYFFSNFSWVMD